MNASNLFAMRQSLEGNFELPDHGRWQASLSLEVKSTQNGAKLSKCRHDGPLYVQKPFYPEGDDLAHIYLLHPPGGIVSGDHLYIDIKVDDSAKALVTTPGAARLYRAREDRALQQQSMLFNVGENASLEWFPLETIIYNDANVSLDTQINLDTNATVFAWEVSCFGLPASGELFEQGSFEQSYRVFRDGTPVFIDRLEVDDGNREQFLKGIAGMQQHAVSGFFIVSAVRKDESLLAQLREVIEGNELEQVLALTHVGECIIARYLGASAEQARKGFELIWQFLRPIILERPSSAPRIWLT